MNRYGEFGYLQARLQARHATQPDPSSWAALEAVGSVARYLQTARGGPLQPWVQHVGLHTGVHEMERSMRQLYRQHVTEVAGWVPHRWRGAVEWLATLIDLPALAHLRSGAAAPHWFHDDPALRPLLQPASTNALAGTIYAPFGSEENLGRAWLREWRARWPKEDAGRYAAGLNDVADAVAENQASLAGDYVRDSKEARHRLEQRLRRHFRRYAFQPAAAFAHLALMVLGLERLRGGLARRILFPPVETESG